MVKYLAKKPGLGTPKEDPFLVQELMPLIRKTAKEVLTVTLSTLAIACAHAGQPIASKSTRSHETVKTEINQSKTGGKQDPETSPMSSFATSSSVKSLFPEPKYRKIAKYLDPESYHIPIELSMSKTAYDPYHYMRMHVKEYGINIGKGIGFVPIPMDTRNATIAYITYVVKHKGFDLYSENSPSGALAITLGKGNHGEVEFSVSLTF